MLVGVDAKVMRRVQKLMVQNRQLSERCQQFPYLWRGAQAEGHFLYFW